MLSSPSCKYLNSATSLTRSEQRVSDDWLTIPLLVRVVVVRKEDGLTRSVHIESSVCRGKSQSDGAAERSFESLWTACRRHESVLNLAPGGHNNRNYELESVISRDNRLTMR